MNKIGVLWWQNDKVEIKIFPVFTKVENKKYVSIFFGVLQTRDWTIFNFVLFRISFKKESSNEK